MAHYRSSGTESSIQLGSQALYRRSGCLIDIQSAAELYSDRFGLDLSYPVNKANLEQSVASQSDSLVVKTLNFLEQKAVTIVSIPDCLQVPIWVCSISEGKRDLQPGSAP